MAIQYIHFTDNGESFALDKTTGHVTPVNVIPTGGAVISTLSQYASQYGITPNKPTPRSLANVGTASSVAMPPPTPPAQPPTSVASATPAPRSLALGTAQPPSTTAPASTALPSTAQNVSQNGSPTDEQLNQHLRDSLTNALNLKQGLSDAQNAPQPSIWDQLKQSGIAPSYATAKSAINDQTTGLDQPLKMADATITDRLQGLKAIEALTPKPDTQIISESDAQGNVTAVTIDKNTGKEIARVSLGKIGKPQTTSATADASVTADAIPSMVDYTLATGNLPPMGFGNAQLRVDFWKQLGEKLKGTGQDFGNIAATKAGLTAATSALRNQQTIYSATQTSLNTLEKQLGLLQEYSSKVDRTGVPVVNKYLLYAKGQFAGDADTQAFQNVVLTASNEFAKILQGSAASIAGVTVSSADDAQKLINSSLTPEQIKKVIDVMRKEANFRLTSQKDTIDGLRTDISNMSKPETPSSTGETTSTTEAEYKAYLKAIEQ